MWSSLRLLLMAVLAVTVTYLGCSAPDSEDSPEPAVPSLALSSTVLPDSAPADGVSRMVVLVELRLGSDPVTDSTQIVLLHSIGQLAQGVLYTQAGMALDTLTTDTVAASGWLIASSQGLRDSTRITFTPVSP